MLIARLKLAAASDWSPNTQWTPGHRRHNKGPTQTEILFWQPLLPKRHSLRSTDTILLHRNSYLIYMIINQIITNLILTSAIRIRKKLYFYEKPESCDMKQTSSNNTTNLQCRTTTTQDTSKSNTTFPPSTLFSHTHTQTIQYIDCYVIDKCWHRAWSHLYEGTSN